MSMNDRERESSEETYEEEAARLNNSGDPAREAMWPHEDLDVENYIGTQYMPVPRTKFRECVRAGFEAIIQYGTQGALKVTSPPRILEYDREVDLPPAVLHACDVVAWTSYERIPSVSLAFWVSARFYALLSVQLEGGAFPIFPKEGVDYDELIPHESFIDAASQVDLFTGENDVYEFDEDQLRFVAIVHGDGYMI